MCNRYKRGERDTVLDLFDIKKIRLFNEGPRIIHPRDPGPVVRLDEGEMTLEQMIWGFPVVRQGKRGPLKPAPTNNARFDKLNLFWKRWAAVPAQRCLIPAASYAEAVGDVGNKTCTWLSLKSAPVFAWAGLWTVSEEWGPVYTGVMTDNAPELRYVHERTPVILAPHDWRTWLTAPLAELTRFDRPWPANDVQVDATDVLWKQAGSESF